MESVLIERRLFRGEADIPDRKVGQARHADIIHGGIAHIEILQRQSRHPDEIEGGAGPCLGCKEIIGLVVVPAVVIAVPDAARHGDIPVAGDGIGVCEEKIAAPLRLFFAEEQARPAVAEDMRIGMDAQRVADAVCARGNIHRRRTGIESRLECRRVVCRTVAESPEIADIADRILHVLFLF